MRLHHVGIAVWEAAPVLVALQEILGLLPDTSEEIPAESVRVHFVPAGAPKIELLESLGDTNSPIGRFLDRRGEGVHHLAFEVKDLDAHMERMRAAGLRPLSAKPRVGAGGNRIYFLHPGDTHGVLLEFCEYAAPTAVLVFGDETEMGASLAFSSHYNAVVLVPGTDIPHAGHASHVVGIGVGNQQAVRFADHCGHALRSLTICNPSPYTTAYQGPCPAMILSVCSEPAAAFELHCTMPGSRLCILPTGGACMSQVLEEHFSTAQ